MLSFSPLHHGRNDLDIFTVRTPKSKVIPQPSIFHIAIFMSLFHFSCHCFTFHVILVEYLNVLLSFQAKLVVCAYKAQLTMPPD